MSRDGKKIISLIDEKGRAVGRVSLVLTSLAVRLDLSITVALLEPWTGWTVATTNTSSLSLRRCCISSLPNTKQFGPQRGQGSAVKY